MKIIKLEEISSTQIYLKEYISHKGYTEPLCILTNLQTNGIGSRGNSWIGKNGNLFFSFVIDINSLPKDLPLQSSSIYFTFILRNILKNLGSKVWIKWPNDFYLEDKKIGGTITSVSKNLFFCGIGINLVDVQKDYDKLDIKIDIDEVLEEYFLELEKKVLWKQIFSEFKIEFKISKKFQTTINEQKISLENAVLNDDGSIEINNEKVFSLR